MPVSTEATVHERLSIDCKPAWKQDRQMTQSSQDTPCPCGSGKKYKACCL
ncbi:MAG: SEC-C domain-containing protein [Marinobacter sp.]|nr:SEC-C domain-containing protein [Marinobacter sp.]